MVVIEKAFEVFENTVKSKGIPVTEAIKNLKTLPKSTYYRRKEHPEELTLKEINDMADVLGIKFSTFLKKCTTTKCNNE